VSLLTHGGISNNEVFVLYQVDKITRGLEEQGGKHLPVQSSGYATAFC